MNNRQLLDEAGKIFDKLEKWNALFEIHGQTEAIMTGWLTKGAQALRKKFADRPAQGWSCAQWESPNETIWYLTEPAIGRDSIMLAFAWPGWEFHLIYLEPAAFDEAKARKLLIEDQFRPLAEKFNPDEKPEKTGKYRSLACDTKFNPFGGSTEGISRRRDLAWYAAHETELFVTLMSERVRGITDDETLTDLVRKLNFGAKAVSPK